jgi:hypothetical protein
MRDDAGDRIAYTALEEGTPVFDNAGCEVGKVEKLLADFQNDIFDGILVAMGPLETRYVDAEHVGDIYERRVELELGADALKRQPRPD